MNDAVKLPRISSVSNVHPWYETAGWTVHTWETKSHEESVELADKLRGDGWLIWIVGNNGNPGLTVYRVDQEYWREKYGHDRPWNCQRPEFGVMVEVCRDDGVILKATAMQSSIRGFWHWKLDGGSVVLASGFKLWRPVVEA